MNVLILSDAMDFLGKDLENRLMKMFEGQSITLFDTNGMDVSPCKGCFRCWIKTPGECIRKDDTMKFNQAFANADLCIILTKIKYGCYSVPIKKVLDRSLPNMLPFFKVISKEVHHPQRYPKKKSALFIAYNRGILGDDAVVFSELAERNAKNFGFHQWEVFFCEKEEDFDKKILPKGGVE